MASHATVTDGLSSLLSPLRHRVLQADRRRYSVKLEEAYWKILEDLAAARGIRLARLIDETAKAAEGKTSLSAALRLYCLEAVTRDAAAGGGRAEAPAAGGGYGASLENLITANPAPCLLLDAAGRILLANDGFQRWSGVKAESLTGQPFDWFFQLRLAESIEKTVAGLAEEGGHRGARVSYIAPGRVVVANGRVCLGHYGGPKDYTWVVMVETPPPPR